ncbi:hypothetical protein ILUMI_26846 [Ignelater luminosus]|uniref:Ferric-chelate reductase 1 n=1 Tax=Ignelater luminosus TaxID=2038154 RepID=A0A8K0C3G4_IGNLU|nr:hypothetical protein ILUMI_26846 [Ignelater luminosus]
MIVVALLLFLSTVNALPQGAPTKVCQTMLPFHGGGIVRQQGPSPYSVTARRINEDEVLVTIKSSIEIPIQGFMLQARIRDGELAGVFEPTSSETHTIDCEQPGDTVTHSSPQPKSAVQVRWKPPLGYLGPVVFNATVAQDYSTFWVGVESEKMRISTIFQDKGTFDDVPGQNPIVTPPHYIPEETTAATRKSDPFYEGCAIKKLCFGVPDKCVSSQDCKAVVAVIVSGDRYEFEMKATGSPAWVGVGLSEDNQMGDDSVLECAKEGNSVKPYLSWTTPRQNLGVFRITNPQFGIQLLNATSADGTLYCKVLRNTKTTVNNKEFDLVKSQYHILIAAGTTLKPNSVGYHDIGRLASEQKRYLSDVSEVAGASKILLRLHGAFMLAAWIGTASLGTFIARYYRKTWVGRTICGKDLWFAYHRFFMVVTWALTTVAFVLIFVELKAWSSENNPHAILGCIVTALCFMQPIGAFFRPHPGTPRRPIFNWMHWLGGNAAHIIAIVTIFFAVKLTKAELPEWFDWILVAFVAFHVLMHLVLSILSCIADNSSNQRVTAFPMKDLNASGKMSAQMVNVDAPFSPGRKLLLGLYVLVIVALTAALIVVSVLAPIES